MPSAFNHNQATSATEWDIEHDLGSEFLAIDVIVNNSGVLSKAIPLAAEVVDANNVRIKFTDAQQGRARIVAGE
jgi:hypothetical protein